MKPRRNNSGRRNGGAAVRSNGNSKKARVALEATEVSILLKACRKYRSMLPVYLLSAKPELLAVDEVIRKLNLTQK